MQIDLHGFCLNEAKEEVFWKLKEIVLNEQNQLDIIHGFRNGQVLKKYFQSKQFLEDIKIYGYVLKPKTNLKNPGMTSFNIRLIK